MKLKTCYFWYLCFYLFSVESILVGVYVPSFISPVYFQHLVRIVPGLQDQEWYVCLERTSAIFHPTILLDEVLRHNGKLWIPSMEYHDMLCSYEQAVKKNEDYLLVILGLDMLSIPVDLKNMLDVHKVEIDHAVFEVHYLHMKSSKHSLIQDHRDLSYLLQHLQQQRTLQVDLLDLLLLPSPAAKISSASVPYQSHTASYHSSPQQIQLWWPLNHTDIFLHQPVPIYLSPLRMKQKFIFVFPKSIASSGSRYIEVRIKDYQYGTIATTTTTTTTAVGEEETPSPPIIRRIFLEKELLVDWYTPQLMESVIEYPHDVTVIPRKKQIVVDILDPLSSGSSSNNNNATLLATFHLELNIVYGTDYWQKGGKNKEIAWHPMVGQLDSRDDLGFALASFLPNASQMVEVGVNNGYFAQLLLETWGQLHSYIGIDPWKSWAEEDYYYDIANAISQQRHEEYYDNTRRRLAPYGQRVLLFRNTSAEAVQYFAAESIDVVYIDAQHHYAAVMEDMSIWWAVVRPGGLLCGHDHLLDVLDKTIFTVKPAVEAFARSHGLVVLQTYDDSRPSYPTWMLFKPLSSH